MRIFWVRWQLTHCSLSQCCTHQTRSFTIVYLSIQARPDLFKIVTPVKVEVFESLLQDHPNRLYVDSVLWCLHNGFWLWVKPGEEADPVQWDNSDQLLKNAQEEKFVWSQFREEIKKGHFSQSFGKHLLPGMFSVPSHAIPIGIKKG